MLLNIFSTYEPRHEKTNALHMQKQRQREADQCLCFRYIDSTIPLLSKASSHLLYLYILVCVGPGQKPECRFSHDVAHICILDTIKYNFCNPQKLLHMYNGHAFVVMNDF